MLLMRGVCVRKIVNKLISIFFVSIHYSSSMQNYEICSWSFQIFIETKKENLLKEIV